jgi:hypothetical protein
MNLSPWWVVATMLSLTGCQTLSDGAKEKFSKDYSCPIDRLESRDRPDLHRSSFHTAAAPTATPPADIAADPARLAVWNQNHKQDPTSFDDLDDIEEVRGCGNAAFYACHHMQRHAGTATCFRESTVPPNISHW